MCGSIALQYHGAIRGAESYQGVFDTASVSAGIFGASAFANSDWIGLDVQIGEGIGGSVRRVYYDLEEYGIKPFELGPCQAVGAKIVSNWIAYNLSLTGMAGESIFRKLYGE